MSNSYKYIDEQSIYIDPKTGVLRNLLGIEDEETLNFVESAILDVFILSPTLDYRT